MAVTAVLAKAPAWTGRRWRRRGRCCRHWQPWKPRFTKHTSRSRGRHGRCWKHRGGRQRHEVGHLQGPGGGGNGGNKSVGGNGGLYGAGGGGGGYVSLGNGSAGGKGADGLIVITY